MQIDSQFFSWLRPVARDYEERVSTEDFSLRQSYPGQHSLLDFATPKSPIAAGFAFSTSALRLTG